MTQSPLYRPATEPQRPPPAARGRPEGVDVVKALVAAWQPGDLYFDVDGVRFFGAK